MPTATALKIFNIVDGKKPMKRDTTIFFEWGNGALLTSVYAVEGIVQDGEKLILQLFVPPTVCKPAVERMSLELASSPACGNGGCC